MRGELLFLGTGASLGVPVVSCLCAVCSSSNEKNKRTRPSVFIQVEGKKFIIDTGPDFRCQALKHHISEPDGVLFTHLHQDHAAGLDDLRAFTYERKHPMACLLSPETLEELKRRFYYLFHPLSSVVTVYSEFFHFQVMDRDFGETVFQGVKVENFSYYQEGMKVTGYRFGSLAYVTDIRDYDEAIFVSLKGVKTLIISALREVPTHVHFSIQEAIDFSRKIKAEKTYFTHISHHVDHDKVQKELPPGFFLAYDGLKISLP